MMNVNINVSGGYKIQVFDKNGKKIKEIEKCSGDLVLTNVFNVLSGLLSGKSSKSNFGQAFTVTDMSNTSYSVDKIDFTNCSGEAAEKDDTYGVLIGSGSTQPTVNDYKLENQIKNDVLEYGACAFQNFGTGNNLKPGLSRKFTNNGSSNVQVSEIGLAVEVSVVQADGSTGTAKILLMRDVINAVSVPAGGILNIEYYFNLNPSS